MGRRGPCGVFPLAWAVVLRNNSILSLWTITFAARIIVRDQISAAEEHLGYDTMHAPASPYMASHWYAADPAGRCRSFPSALSASICRAGSRKPLSA